MWWQTQQDVQECLFEFVFCCEHKHTSSIKVARCQASSKQTTSCIHEHCHHIYETSNMRMITTCIYASCCCVAVGSTLCKHRQHVHHHVNACMAQCLASASRSLAPQLFVAEPGRTNSDTKWAFRLLVWCRRRTLSPTCHSAPTAPRKMTSQSRLLEQKTSLSFLQQEYKHR